MTIKEESHINIADTLYRSRFTVSPPKESHTYIRSFVFSRRSGDHGYDGRFEWKDRDREISDEIQENLRSIGASVNMRMNSYSSAPCYFTFEYTSAYRVGQIFHCLASLKLIPCSLLTTLLEKAKAPIRIDDFDLSVSLFNSRIEKKCGEYADKECGTSPSEDKCLEKYDYDTKRKFVYRDNFINFAIDEFKKIKNPRQRATLVWEFSETTNNYGSTIYKNVSLLYDLLNEASLPFYREGQRGRIRCLFAEVKENSSGARDEEKLFPLIRTYLWLDESMDHDKATEIAHFYLGFSNYEGLEKLSNSPESVAALLSKLRSKMTACKNIREEYAAEVVAEYIIFTNTEEIEKKLQETLQQGMSDGIQISLYDITKKRLIKEESNAVDTSLLHLEAISSLLSLDTQESLEKAHEHVKKYLEIPDSDKEWNIDLSDRVEAIFTLLKKIRQTDEERKDFQRKYWERRNAREDQNKEH